LAGKARRIFRAFLVVFMFHALAGGGARLGGQTPDSTAVVRGRVLEQGTDAPLRGAAVSLASGPDGTRGIGTRVTGDSGDFLFRRVPAGLYRVSVTLLGYTDLRDTLRVEEGSGMELVLPLSASPIPLEPIVVSAERRRPDHLAGFERRRRTLGGTFMDRQEIEGRGALVFTDLLRTVPGARVVPVSYYGHGVLFRGGCAPSIVIDGLRLSPTRDLDALLQPMDVEALEVYTGSFIPAEFGPNSCGAIVVWTRRGEPNIGQGSFWRRLLVAVGFISLAWLLVH
jgi:hypothetical protein